jgi:DNA-directed RNA polymerase specialized sigma24 family protein
VTPPKKHLALALEGEEAGTVLGTVAWVLGALEIMKDRGHAEGDERFHDLYDTLEPRLQALVARISGARMAMGSEEALQDEIEAAYAPVREAFETWISLTASDTLSAAVGQRLGDAFDAAEESDTEE